MQEVNQSNVKQSKYVFVFSNPIPNFEALESVVRRLLTT